MYEIRQEEINLSKCLQHNSQCKTLFFEKHGSMLYLSVTKAFLRKKGCLW